MYNTIYFAADTVTTISTRVGESWPWYIIRAAGFIAAFLLIALMISGIGQVTGLTYRFIEPIKAWMLHKAMGIALLIAVAIHMLFLFVDKYLPFSLAELFIPLQSTYSNGTSLFGWAIGSLAVTFGVLAMYGIVILIASSLGWIDTHKKAWRWLHYVSYAVVVLVFAHVLLAGTDVKYGTFRIAWVSFGLIIVLAILSRLRRVGTLRNRSSDTSD